MSSQLSMPPSLLPSEAAGGPEQALCQPCSAVTSLCPQPCVQHSPTPATGRNINSIPAKHSTRRMVPSSQACLDPILFLKTKFKVRGGFLGCYICLLTEQNCLFDLSQLQDRTLTMNIKSTQSTIDLKENCALNSCVCDTSILDLQLGCAGGCG